MQKRIFFSCCYTNGKKSEWHYFSLPTQKEKQCCIYFSFDLSSSLKRTMFNKKGHTNYISVFHDSIIKIGHWSLCVEYQSVVQIATIKLFLVGCYMIFCCFDDVLSFRKLKAKMLFAWLITLRRVIFSYTALATYVIKLFSIH